MSEPDSAWAAWAAPRSSEMVDSTAVRALGGGPGGGMPMLGDMTMLGAIGCEGGSDMAMDSVVGW